MKDYIRSKVPSRFSDEEWTDMVFARVRDSYSGLVLDSMTINPFILVQEELVEEHEDEPEYEYQRREIPIDLNAMKTMVVTASEAQTIRGLLKGGCPFSEVVEVMGVSEQDVRLAADGNYWPCVGGPLLPLPNRGLHMGAAAKDRQREMVIAGVLARAHATLSERYFQLLVEQNGMDVQEAYDLMTNMETQDEFERRRSYRRILSGVQES